MHQRYKEEENVLLSEAVTFAIRRDVTGPLGFSVILFPLKKLQLLHNSKAIRGVR